MHNFMKTRFIAFLILFAITVSSVSASEKLPRLKFRWGATIHGWAYRTIVPDDRMIYEAMLGDVYEDMLGLRWTNFEKSKGNARFRNVGIYERALRISREAQHDPILMNPPESVLQRMDAEIDYFSLDPEDLNATISGDGCLSDNDSYTKPERVYSRHIQKLLKDLNLALETEGLMLQ